MFHLGAQEIVVLIILGVLLFGKRLPEVGGHLAKAIRVFRSTLQGHEVDDSHGSVGLGSGREQSHPPQRITASMREEYPKFNDRESEVEIREAVVPGSSGFNSSGGERETAS